MICSISCETKFTVKHQHTNTRTPTKQAFRKLVLLKTLRFMMTQQKRRKNCFQIKLNYTHAYLQVAQSMSKVT